MSRTRFIPARAADRAQSQANDRFANALDSVVTSRKFKLETAASLNVAAGELRRLAPRADGMEVIVPAAGPSNFDQTITLQVRGAQGALRIRAASGTINGASAYTIPAGRTSLIVLMSDGETGWVTERVFPAAGNGLAYDGETLNYVGSSSLLRLTGSTGNLGTIDISTLECGGSLCIVAAADDYQIEGFTSTPAKGEGFWFVLTASDTSVIATIFNEDGTAAAADRIRCPNSEAFIGTNLQGTVHAAPDDGLPGGINRWRLVAGASAPRYAVVDLVTTVGTITDLALGFNANRLRMGGGAGDRLLVSMDPGENPNGRVVIIQNIDGTATDDLEVQHDDGATGTAAWRFVCADQVNARIGSRGMGIAVYDSTSARWYLTVVHATRLISIHSVTAADASYSVTVPGGATWFKVFAKAGGSGGGGADSETALEVTAGGGGGEGCEAELWFPVSTGAITGAVGGGGTAGSNAGGNGGVGGGTTVIYNGSTYTLNQGGIGIGTAAGIVGAGASATLGGSGGGGALTAGAEISIYSRYITGANGDPGIMLGAAAVTAEAAIVGNGAGQGGGRGGQVVAAAGASNGSNAASQGCGGGGGARIVSASAVATGATGGTGSAGYVRIEFYSGLVPTFSAIT